MEETVRRGPISRSGVSYVIYIVGLEVHMPSQVIGVKKREKLLGRVIDVLFLSCCWSAMRAAQLERNDVLDAESRTNERLLRRRRQRLGVGRSWRSVVERWTVRP